MQIKTYLLELKEDHVKIDGDNAEIRLGMLGNGSFPIKKGFSPEFGNLALFYIKEYGGSRNVVAVDTVYQDKNGFKSVRLLGDEKEVPMVTGESQVRVRFAGTQLARRRIKIGVVEHEGERFFKVDDVMFDLLNAYDEFVGGKLSIVRDGEIIDRTGGIYNIGSHDACPHFCGLDKFFDKEDYRSRSVSSLSPGNFQAGDILLLDIPATLNFDLVCMIKRSAQSFLAILEVFKEKNEMSLMELRNSMNEKIGNTAGEFSKVTIVRFPKRS